MHHIKYNAVFYALMCKPFLAENGTSLAYSRSSPGESYGYSAVAVTLFFIRRSFCGCCCCRNSRLCHKIVLSFRKFKCAHPTSHLLENCNHMRAADVFVDSVFIHVIIVMGYRDKVILHHSVLKS